MLKKIAIFIVSLSAFFGCLNVCQAGLGVSPSRLIEKNLLKGSHLEKTFYISRSDAAADLRLKAVIEAPEIESWLNLEFEEFVLKSGENTFALKLTVDVPPGAAPGAYQAGIRITSLPGQEPSGAGTGSEAMLGVLAQLDLAVIDRELFAYQVSDIAISPVKIGEPIYLAFNVENSGNVPAGPVAVKVNFLDRYKSQLLRSYEISGREQIESAAPFSYQTILVPVPNELEIGQYWAQAEIYGADGLLLAKELIFDVLSEEGFKTLLAQKKQSPPKIKEITPLATKNLKNIASGAIGLLIIIGLGFGIFWFKKTGLNLSAKIKKQHQAPVKKPIKKKLNQ